MDTTSAILSPRLNQNENTGGFKKFRDLIQNVPKFSHAATAFPLKDTCDDSANISNSSVRFLKTQPTALLNDCDNQTGVCDEVKSERHRPKNSRSVIGSRQREREKEKEKEDKEKRKGGKEKGEKWERGERAERGERGERGTLIKSHTRQVKASFSSSSSSSSSSTQSSWVTAPHPSTSPSVNVMKGNVNADAPASSSVTTPVKELCANFISDLNRSIHACPQTVRDVLGKKEALYFHF